MPTMSVLIGAAAGALITFLLTTCRRWRRRRRLAEDAAKTLAPHLETLSTAVTDALAAYSWEPLDSVELTDHSMPRLTKQVIDGLRQRTAEPFTDGLLAVHELDRARETVTLAAAHQRERVEDYRRRIDVAGAIASIVADSARGLPRHDHY
jgi:isopentenyl diphosphate isomerase/L-lactate dehydrogenase-like FMN-dependent dehydrogenase